MDKPPTLLALAGPNGAGKSTFYRQLLADKRLPFVNADEFARELAIDAYEAARIAEEVRWLKIAHRESFVMETVFSDPIGAKIHFMETASAQGYEVTLFFFGLESPELSATRVRSRVKAGGHDVPTDKLMARYARTLDNLQRAIPRLPRIVVYDNSSYREPYRLLGEFRDGDWQPTENAPKVQWFQRLDLDLR